MRLFDDPDGRDRLLEDGWTRDEIEHRDFLDAEGRYAGPVTERVVPVGPGQDVLEVAAGLLQRVKDFRQSMVDQGIHVGVNGTCATCGETWPCQTERP